MYNLSIEQIIVTIVFFLSKNVIYLQYNEVAGYRKAKIVKYFLA